MNSIIRKIIALTALAFLFGCGGGSDSGGIGGTGVTSSGVMTKGSVILNGVRFEDTTANILIDDTPKTAANLQDGMVVQVRGTITQGGNGTAQQIEAQIEVRGIVTSVDAAASPQSFVVLGQTVLVDDLTVLSGINTFGEIVAGTTLVEVFGLRDTSGRVRATRVEANTAQMGDSTVDEIRGIVSNLTGSAFNLGTQVVLIDAAAVIVPAGATFANGSVVEVHCTSRPLCINGSSQFVATRIEVESAEDSAFQPGMNERFEVEGLVSQFSGHPGDFFVAGVPVTTSASTVFEGGIATDLWNDVEVEAEGVWDGSKLVASKIEFERSVIRLQGIVLAAPAPTGNTFTLQIGDPAVARNVAIETDSFTQGAVPAAGPTCVQVRGQRKAGFGVVVTAGEIDNNCSNGGDHVLQAPLDAKAEPNLTLLGLPAINVSGAQFRDLNDNPITQGAFFSLISAPDPGPPAVAGTLVRVRFDKDNLSTVSEVELED